jgi:DNA-binding PadR family transcriptional regulator
MVEMRKIDKQMTKGLLDIIVLTLLRSNSMHGYKIITSIRKNFGVYFGPSTVYPFLKNLEEKGLIKSHWDTNHDRPRKVFSLTPNGNNVLTGTEQSFKSMCMQLNRMGMSTLSSFAVKPSNSINNQVGMY